MMYTYVVRQRSRLALALACLIGLSGGGIVAQPADNAVLIVPPIAAAAPATTARGVFYQRALAVTLPAGPALLAASPDGQGWLCTDDQVTLTFAAGGRPALTWSQRFASADRRAITCIPPQPLALAAGTYQVTVTLDDLYPNTYGTRAYYLVFSGAAAAPRGTWAPAESPAPAAPIRAGATMGTAATPTAPPTTRAVPPAPSRLARVEPTTVTPDVQGTPYGELAWWVRADRPLIATGLLAGAALLLIAARLVRRLSGRRRVPAPRLTGIIYLFDQETREARTEILSGNRHCLAVQRRPLRLAAVAADEAAGAGIAQIRPSPNGLLLYEPAADAAVPLVHDRLYALAGGAVTLRYREPGGGGRRRSDDRRPTTDDRRWTMNDHRLHRILSHIVAFIMFIAFIAFRRGEAFAGIDRHGTDKYNPLSIDPAAINGRKCFAPTYVVVRRGPTTNDGRWTMGDGR